MHRSSPYELRLKSAAQSIGVEKFVETRKWSQRMPHLETGRLGRCSGGAEQERRCLPKIWQTLRLRASVYRRSDGRRQGSDWPTVIYAKRAQTRRAKPFALIHLDPCRRDRAFHARKLLRDQARKIRRRAWLGHRLLL